MKTNPNAMLTLHSNCIFTNVAFTDDGDVWWEGIDGEVPKHLIDWNKKDWTPESGRVAAHSNSRFTAPASQCPVIDPAWEDPKGVPISAFLFGGRRPHVIPLVNEAYDWNHGVYMGSSASSETTSAAAGAVGKIRHDPFAMLPFCGYNMGDYFGHWIQIGRMTLAEKLPKIFYVNWFRKDEDGKFMWPGYTDNVRVLKWVIERVNGTGKFVDTPIGRVPAEGAIEVDGIGVTPETMKKLFTVNNDEWKGEVTEMREYYKIFGDRLPKQLSAELDKIEARLKK
jgi:phosphoenolpyruvate carboxykinase (GTP)